MNVELKELLSLYKESDVDDFLKRLTGHNLNETDLTFNDIKDHWSYLGNNSSNGSVIGMLKKGEKGLIERITNAIDAVVEKKKSQLNIVSAKNSSVIISKAFPKYYSNSQELRKGGKGKASIKDAENQVILAVTDANRLSKPTFDVVDKGTGLRGDQFSSTILSINAGNKISSDRGYLIGAFGQGGSTSIPFTSSTIIISKQDGRYWFTVVKAVDLQELKTTAYVYLTIDGEIPEAVSADGLDTGDKEWLKTFIESDSGTLVRMVEMDISADFRKNDIAKPGMLGDYVNTQLFDVGLPVRIIDNRKSFADNSSSQTRYAYGTAMKLLTYKYVQKDYCGSITIEHNNREYKIDYYVLLPEDTNLWGSDADCKNIFRQFNVTCDPIIYTVNGQTVTSETFTCIKNAGLTFLRYRLLVVINLDILGSEKYKFFTTDRSQIKQTDLTKGFLDKVVSQLGSEENLKRINEHIATIALNGAVDANMLSNISQRVKKNYANFLKNAGITIGNHNFRPGPNPIDALDEIDRLIIRNTKNEFYRDEIISVLLETGAQKFVNKQALESNSLNLFLDGNYYGDFVPTSFNARIVFKLGHIKPGNHTVDFDYYEGINRKLASEPFDFTVLNESAPAPENKKPIQDLNLEILQNSGSELICDVSKIKEEHKIIITINLEHALLYSKLYGNKLASAADQLSNMQRRMIEPIAMFALLMDSRYDNIQSSEEKNELMLAFLKTYFSCKDEEEE